MMKSRMGKYCSSLGSDIPDCAYEDVPTLYDAPPTISGSDRAASIQPRGNHTFARSQSILVPTGRLELPRLSPLPPQDSVSTNFTTSAFQESEFRGQMTVASASPSRRI